MLLGLKENELERCVPVTGMKPSFVLQQMLTPKWAGRRISKGPMDMIKMVLYFSKEMKEMKSQKNCKDFDGITSMDVFPALASSTAWRQAEMSSANFQANARGTAKLASIMALKGGSLISEDTWNEFHSEPTTAAIFKSPGQIYIIHID